MNNCFDRNTVLILIIILVLIFVFLFLFWTRYREYFSNNNFKLLSTDFINNQIIPKKYSCEENHNNIFPTLYWINAPLNTKSFAIIMEDPDVPIEKLKDYEPERAKLQEENERGWLTHWLVYNIPGKVKGIDSRSNCFRTGKNSAEQNNYFPSCPPKGDIPHRYIFTIYALNCYLNLDPSTTTAEILKKEINNHLISKSQLVGIYKIN